MLFIKEKSDLEFNRQNLRQKNMELIKNALKQNIFSDNPLIHAKCCKAYSYIFSTLTTDWQDGIDCIVNSFTNVDFSSRRIFSFFSIMKEIVNQINFVSEIIDPFRQQFDQAFNFTIDMLSEDPINTKISIEYRVIACDFVTDLIKVFSDIINQDKVLNTLKRLRNSFQILDFKMYESLEKLILIIIQKFYPLSPSFIGIIEDYFEIKFDLLSIQPNLTNIMIFFWNNVAKLEMKITDQCDKKSKEVDDIIKPLMPLLIEREAERLVHRNHR